MERYGWSTSSPPARIGSVEIPNRIVMPPMTTRLADKEGRVTDDTVNYYMARVRGGVRKGGMGEKYARCRRP